MVNGAAWYCPPLLELTLTFFHTGGVGDGDIVAQNGYPLQSEGRTPGDEDSGGVDRGHSEVTD